MPAFYKGEPIFGPRGPAGPDGNPVGTVISFMGTSAPEDYLVCDGAEYPIGDYPDLAEHFRQQFGAAVHFGGDGENTFAVPDLRNLFLRGYHCGAEEQLSGEVGEKQKATEIPYLEIYSDEHNTHLANYARESINIFPQHQDKATGGEQSQLFVTLTPDPSLKKTNSATYTTRPVNTAVLFCIKAVGSAPAENVYSLKETRIGTWVNRKPLYRRCYPVAINAGQAFVQLTEDIAPVFAKFTPLNGDYLSFDNYFVGVDDQLRIYYSRSDHELKVFASSGLGITDIMITLEYIKTTD